FTNIPDCGSEPIEVSKATSLMVKCRDKLEAARKSLLMELADLKGQAVVLGDGYANRVETQAPLVIHKFNLRMEQLYSKRMELLTSSSALQVKRYGLTYGINMSLDHFSPAARLLLGMTSTSQDREQWKSILLSLDQVWKA
ncbi:hypothetical protein DXG01_014407, partial [Tephrocybe rancida]